VRLACEPEFRDIHFDFVTRAYQGPVAENIGVFDDLEPNSPRMVDLYREADLYALPTRADSHAIATLEAMAMGLPVISTPVGGVVDVVRDGETGFLVPREDPAALADRIRKLRDDRSLRLRLGRAGRQRVESEFNAETIAATVVDLLSRAARRP
jgi:glycosyltransferase involved in cell wall biosynthesis